MGEIQYRLPDGEVQKVSVPVEANAVSDGYHTFGELYEHRCKLFALVVLLNGGMTDKPGKPLAWKTRADSRGDEWPGWFIAGLTTPYGQITYHLPDVYWDELPIRTIEKNADYDGHTSDDVLKRLDQLIRDAA